MNVEVLVRWQEPLKNEEVAEERKMKRILYGEDLEESEEGPLKTTYDKLILDLEDVKVHYRLDDLHTVVKIYDGDSYCIQLPWNTYKQLYTQSTGKSILELTYEEIDDDDV